MSVSVHCYADRNRTLRELGYPNYAAYLASDLWGKLKERAFQELGRECKLCDSPAKVLHHKGYGRAVLLGESIKQLVPLCHWHHKLVEFDARGKKRTLIEAHTALIRLWKKSPKRGQKKFNRCEVCGCKLSKCRDYCRNCRRREQGLPYYYFSKPC